MRTCAVALGLAWILLSPGFASAAREEDREISAQGTLEDALRRIERLESQTQDGTQDHGRNIADWVKRLRISGNADIGYLNGAKNARSPTGAFLVENARLFFDLDLGPFDEPALRRFARSGSVFVEWDLFREGGFKNRIGSLYFELNSLADQEWLNLRLGRTPIPFGIEYLRFHEERPDNPLFSYSVTAPYNWDEGLSLFGSLSHQRFRYVLSVMDGDQQLGVNSAADPAIALRLTYVPSAWAEVSISGFRSGRLKGDGDAAGAAIEFAGVHPHPFGSGSDLPNFVDGVAVPDDASLDVDEARALEVDLVLRSRLGRAWFAYGGYQIESGSSFYDREIRYWSAEGMLELAEGAAFFGGRRSADWLAPWYFALRYSGVSTFDEDEGYLFGFMNEGDLLGFNTKEVHAISVGLGYRLRKSVRLKLEYSQFFVDPVRGLPSALRRLARSKNYVGVFLSAGF